MPKSKLKSTRRAEARKIDLAVKYAAQGKETGGGHIHPRKLRHAMEARYIPTFESIVPKSGKKKKR